IIKDSIQLVDARLIYLQCELLSGNDNFITTTFERNVELISDKDANIYLSTTLEFEKDSQFSLHCIHKGHCLATLDLNEVEFERYLYSIAVPLLLPYARECVANTMIRMGLAPYNLPTMDILLSDESNNRENEGGE
ncbi:MAG TPA: hypothetical protein VFC74_07340, partial [Oscillospiraceae bacterium]|nr:hypothetical protein [Oscillospiraceae bacterium]